MSNALRDGILSLKGNLCKAPVTVPGWPDGLFVREMTGRERDVWDDSMVELHGDEVRLKARDNLTARLVVLTLVGADGKRIFADSDIAKVGELGSESLAVIYQASAKLNKLARDDIEDEAKNSTGATAEGSGTS